MTNELNTQIERNTSFSIVLEPSIDFTGWTLIYLAKSIPTDTDEEAIIKNITPIIRTNSNNIKEVVIPFIPSITKNLNVGYLHHSLRAISSDSLNVITLFNGTLKITQNIIGTP